MSNLSLYWMRVDGKLFSGNWQHFRLKYLIPAD